MNGILTAATIWFALAHAFLLPGLGMEAFSAATFKSGWNATNGLNRVRFEVKTNFYDITGSNLREIQQALAAVRPYASSFDGWTDWRLRCSFQPRRAGNWFVLESFEIRARATVTLPRWMPTRKVEPGLREAWWSYLKALAAHEHGHLKIAREAVTETEKRLVALPRFASSRELMAAADAAVQRTTAEARAKEREYDRSTAHGASQGAILIQSRQR